MLKKELFEATEGVLKRGYLYKVFIFRLCYYIDTKECLLALVERSRNWVWGEVGIAVFQFKGEHSFLSRI